MDFNFEVSNICNKALKTLGEEKLKFRPMNRKKPVNPKKSYAIGRTNLKTGLITIDILTPRRRQAKKISSILRILCHEVAHHQKPPFLQKHKGKWINRQHFPSFYKQVTKNISLLKNHKSTKQYF